MPKANVRDEVAWIRVSSPVPRVRKNQPAMFCGLYWPVIVVEIPTAMAMGAMRKADGNRSMPESTGPAPRTAWNQTGR